MCLVQLERVLGANLESAFRRLQQMRGGPREVNITMKQTSKKFVEVHIKGTAVAVQVRTRRTDGWTSTGCWTKPAMRAVS